MSIRPKKDKRLSVLVQPTNGPLDPDPTLEDPRVFVAKVDNTLVWDLVSRTGLPFPTVRSLMLRGWSFQQGLNNIPMWIAPAANMRRQDGTVSSSEEGGAGT